MIVFYIVSLFSLFFARLAEKKQSLLLFVFSALCLALLCGLRAENVGTDTHTYTTIFETIQSGGLHFDSDIGFYYIVKFIIGFTNSVPLTFALISIITVSFIYYTIWYYRRQGSISFMVFIFICFFYPQMFNIVRQMLALAVVFAATTQLEQKRPFVFCLILALATSIHISSLVCVGFLAVHILQNLKNKPIIFYMVVVLFLVFFIYFYSSVTLIYDTRFAYMQEDYQTTLGYEVLAQLITLVFLMISNYKIIKNDAEYTRISIFCIIGIVLSVITANAGEASRIAYFYTIYYILFAAVVLKDLPNRAIGYWGFFLLGLLNFVYRISVSGWYGIYPYSMTNL